MKIPVLINKVKKLINLPYNKFSLENYQTILEDSLGVRYFFKTSKPNLPIQLMSNNNPNAGIINYDNNLHNKGRIFVVGKGILFDSGGLDLKRGMADMKNDKAGMIIALATSIYFNDNVISWCPVTTNFIHNSLITPGDIIPIGKKDVEVTNTDAEGRLILAEALSDMSVTEKDIVITIATLTGCVEYAVGKATGVFSPNKCLVNKYLEASTKEKELAWELPLWADLEKKHYSKKLIQNSVKDIKCGATEGALFLKQFIAFPNNWLHLDIAASISDAKGKTNGVPLKSLISFINSIRR
jgi:leucyl aminopeptidase